MSGDYEMIKLVVESFVAIIREKENKIAELESKAEADRTEIGFLLDAIRQSECREFIVERIEKNDSKLFKLSEYQAHGLIDYFNCN